VNATLSVPLVEGRGLSKAYPGVLALDDVSFDIEAGEVVGLVGMNGAGKSTLIKMLAGAGTPDAGTIFVDGEATQLGSPQSATQVGLAFVHQELADVPNLSVADNVFLGLGLPKIGPFIKERELHSRAKTLLELLEAQISPRAKVGVLSPVQQRLVMIAHALAQRARMIVLDEPSTALTGAEVEHLHSIIRRLSEDGKAVLYVSHRLSEIRSLTSRILVMRDGKMVDNRPTSDVSHAELVRLIVGSSSAGIDIKRRARATPAEEPNQTELLRVDDVRVEPLVKRASLTINAGEVVGIAGLLGSGRTEIARVIAGALRPTAGRIVLKGDEVKLRSPADAINAGVVLLPEDRRAEGNILDLTLRENVTLPSLKRVRLNRFLPMPSRAKERRTTASVSKELQIRSAGSETPVRWLSGGNQQKVLFAKWLTRGADVLVLDEPTQGIDVGAKEEIFDVIDRLRAEGKGVLFISSDFSELVRICDHVVVLREGETVARFSGDEITEHSLVEACYSVTGGS
jgi:ABC-type sugar transport system ATPase subunit